MKDIAIYTLTSPLHDEHSVAQSTREFLSQLRIDHDLVGPDFSTYGQSPLSLIYVRTGGTENQFLQLLSSPDSPLRPSQLPHPLLLLASDSANSLAASMEILSHLRQHNIPGEILHGPASYVSHRIGVLLHVARARRQLRGARYGIIGQPSDWLIASQPCPQAVSQQLGVQLIDIPIRELLDALPSSVTPTLRCFTASSAPHAITSSLTGAEAIQAGLETLVQRHRLQGFTLRCFDLLTALRNTGCLALARLNAQGLVATCEGDVPAMLSMAVARSLLGVSGFQANPASIDPQTGQITLAHCTIPLDMVTSYELDTHFESGIGIGIRGHMAPGPVTLFKLSGDLSRHFIAQGRLLRGLSRPNLCRTQFVVQLANPSQAHYFLTQPIGNHHILLPGHQAELLEAMLATLQPQE